MLLATHERRLIRRYLLPGRSGGFALLIAAIGCAGVAIGVAALVLVISFLNGAETRLAGKIASADGHLFVTARPNALGTWSGLEARLKRTSGVAGVAASTNATAFLSVDGRSLGVDLQGIAPSTMAMLPQLQRGSSALLGEAPLKPGTAAIGGELASRLGVGPGDHVAITMPSVVDGALAVQTADMAVAGVISTEVETFDTRRVVLPLSDFQAIVGRGRGKHKLDVWLARPDQQDAFASGLRQRLGGNFVVTTWREINAALFAALAQERLVMTVIISLVTLVALFNIMSSLTMLVRHRAREIAILRTMGMSSFSAAKIFVGIGAVIGLAGEAVGLAAGFGLKAAKDPIAHALRSQWAKPSVELDVLLSLPLSISTGELGWVLALVTAGVIVSTLHPALYAARLDPAAVLAGR